MASENAFAAILETGDVMTWGDPDSGGDCSRVQQRLKAVQSITATDHAFAALCGDGSLGLLKAEVVDFNFLTFKSWSSKIVFQPFVFLVCFSRYPSANPRKCCDMGP